jgi:predicted Zn-dependent peptidase
VLSSRLFQKLREKQGLAYSTSAAAKFDRGFGWYHLTIGTATRNYRRALDGLTLQTEKLALDGPTAVEIRTARNRMWGRLMSAKLSRINQAYYLGVNEFLGREVSYDHRLLELLDQVDTQSVRRVASRHFNPSTWVIATAGRAE